MDKQLPCFLTTVLERCHYQPLLYQESLKRLSYAHFCFWFTSMTSSAESRTLHAFSMILACCTDKIVKSVYPNHGQTLKQTTKTRYLGVVLDSTLFWKSHADVTAKKANTITAFLHGNLSTCPCDGQGNTSTATAVVCGNILGSTHVFQHYQAGKYNAEQRGSALVNKNTHQQHNSNDWNLLSLIDVSDVQDT